MKQSALKRAVAKYIGATGPHQSNLTGSAQITSPAKSARQAKASAGPAKSVKVSGMKARRTRKLG